MVHILRLSVNFIVLGVIFGLSISLITTGTLKPLLAISEFMPGFIISFLTVVSNNTFLRQFKHWPFILYVSMKTMFASLIAVTVIFFHIKQTQTHLNQQTLEQIIATAIIFSIGISLGYNLFVMNIRMLGRNVFYAFFTGKYHKPKEEQRIFMFIDLVSSTAAAEKLGHRKFFAFLNEVFSDISPIIQNHKGTIYKYLGDEIIVTWTMKDGIQKSRCIQSFVKIQKQLEIRAIRYTKKYGIVPQFRAALHMGKVMVGELGDVKREIAFLGDTVNTTARLQTEAKKRQLKLLISGDLLHSIPNYKTLNAKSLGTIKLKGKEIPTAIFCVTC